MASCPFLDTTSRLRPSQQHHATNPAGTTCHMSLLCKEGGKEGRVRGGGGGVAGNIIRTDGDALHGMSELAHGQNMAV